MNATTIVYAVSLLLMGGVMLALPALSPAPFLFGVRVGLAFRKTGPGRHAVHTYYAFVSAGLAIAGGLAFALGPNQNWTWMLVTLLPYAAAGVGYYLANRDLRQYAAAAGAPPVREADLFAAEDRLPRWLLWAVPPFLMPLAGAAYVQAHWSQIPARIAVHYGPDGQPNRWVARTPLHAYGLFVFAAGLMLWILLLGIVSYFGARRSPVRGTVLGVLVSVMYLLGAVFTGAGVMPVCQFPLWFPIAILPLYIAGVVYWCYRKLKDPAASPAESTPDECWTLGGIYRNPNDPALFVAKRVGYGYTINFGNPLAKWVGAVFLGGIALLTGFICWVMR